MSVSAAILDPASVDPERIDGSKTLRWVGCIAVIAALHAGAGLLVANWQVPVHTPEAALAVVMMDLPPVEPEPPAPEPPAPPPPEPPPPIPAPPPPPPPPPPEPPPPEPPPPEPPPPIPEPPLPVEIPPAPLAPKPVAVVPPKPKPIPRPKPQKPVEQPKPVEAPPPQVYQPAPPQPAPPAPAPAAPPPPAYTGPPPTDAIQLWNGRVIAVLRAEIRYPNLAKMRNQTGEALVRFRVDRNGNVSNVQLVRSSGHEILDEEAVSLLKRAKLPPFPPEMSDATVNRTVPVPFKLHGR